MAQEAVLEGLTGGRGLSDYDKDKGMLYKRAKLLPEFPGSRCKNEPDLWEDWWEKAYAIQTTLSCEDIFLAYMIKENAKKDTELYQTLEHLKHTDGSLDAAGLAGVKKLMEEDFAPSGHLMMARSRDRVRESFRKFKEKPKWWFRRFDRYYSIAKTRDPDFLMTPDELATHFLNHSGLD